MRPSLSDVTFFPLADSRLMCDGSVKDHYLRDLKRHNGLMPYKDGSRHAGYLVDAKIRRGELRVRLDDDIVYRIDSIYNDLAGDFAGLSEVLIKAFIHKKSDQT
jgi:hypothetical protein